MGWFDKQIRDRHKQDMEQMDEAYRSLASVVDKRFRKTKEFHDRMANYDALKEIAAYFHVAIPEIPENICDINEKMNLVLSPAGIMWRRIKLEGEWWKDISGALLCEKVSGGEVALLPTKAGQYYFFDNKIGKSIKLDGKSAKLLQKEAVCFYRPLPQGKISFKDLIRYMFQSFSPIDLGMLAVVGLIITLTGMLTPAATSILFDAIVPSGKAILLYTIAFMLLGAAISVYLFTVVQTVYRSKILQQMKLNVRSALFMRLLGMPVDFFKNYSSGDLAKRVMAADQLCEIFGTVVLGTGVTAIFSMAYIVQIFIFTPFLTIPALLAFILQFVVGLLLVRLQSQVFMRQLKAESKLNGVVYALFSGIQKIKLAGCEERAFAKWAAVYKEKAEAAYNPRLLLRIYQALAPAVSILGLLFIYAAAAGKVTVSQYAAFTTAFGMVGAAISSLLQAATSLSVIKPTLELMKPILDTEMEKSKGKELVYSLNGTIELNNVSFRYTHEGPWIIKDLDLKIRKGQYVAIVGTTGCGKTTLMRIMLGFEIPEIGAVYYDDKDLAKLDQRSLRKHIGVVMQNGKLFAGDIFSNIAVSAPNLSMSEAWEAAEAAGIAEDIRNMPMQMNTLVSDGGGGISGGQKQRIMIARAVAHKPKVLMLDEATSALDNITQKKVAESLAKIKCTRIVIAHRLSTIRQCDRIIVLDQGKIVEDGTYDELVGKGGIFSKLVERQQIPENEQN